MQNIKIPTTIIIFGAFGDLSSRKLIPALFDLYVKKLLPPVFRIVGFSRGPLDENKFRIFAKNSIKKKKHGHKKKDLDSFVKHIFFQEGLFEDAYVYQSLAEMLIASDDQLGKCSNKLFYLAVPPSFYDTIFHNLANSGLSISCGGAQGWTRVLVEKPFGKDAKTAKKLDKTLSLLFKEEQIFRIDHYLAKETLQDILTFRFSNALFEPTWNNAYIEKVEIKLFEKLGVENRGAFYDEVGALRDVGENHVLQMLALVTMEDPEALDAVAIRKKRAEVLQFLSYGKDNKTIRGQYKNFKKEKGVSPHSETETYFWTEARIDNKRWQGVPFFLESGKYMKEKKTTITIYFKKNETCLCPPNMERHHQNILTFRVQPEEGIEVLFWAKKPGFVFGLDSKKLSFSYYDKKEKQQLPDAYERVLFDCILGDQTLFTSTQEIEAAWQFITPIMQGWKSNKLYTYKKGVRGLDDVVGK